MKKNQTQIAKQSQVTKKTETNAFAERNMQENLREGDSGLGVPRSEIAPIRVLSTEETKAFEKEEEAKARKEAEELLHSMTDESGFMLPKVLQRAFSIFLLLLAAVLGIMIVTDTVQFFANIQSFSPTMQWLCISLFVVFSCIIISLIFLMLRKVVRLQRSPRINLKALKTLAERQHLQKIVLEKQIDAKKMLEKYLEEYPLTPKQEEKFTSFGMDKKQWENLQKIQKELITVHSPKYAMSPEDWCVYFQENFQNILDTVAKNRVKAYAKRCALGTALMPFSLIDRLIVFYSCLSMVKDLLRIYHLKPSMGQSVVIFAKAIIVIYLSGIVEENAEYVAESFSESLKDNFSDSALESITGTIGTAINAKAAEATLNYFFINRLGKKSIQLLQPTRKGY